MTNKEIAMQFLQLCINGKVDEAYQKYVDNSGKHHNIYFEKGFPTLQKAMKDSPHGALKVINALEDGDLVAVHSHVTKPKPNFMNVSVVHLFRFKNKRIIEMWDTGMDVPLEIPNKDGAF